MKKVTKKVVSVAESKIATFKKRFSAGEFCGKSGALKSIGRLRGLADKQRAALRALVLRAYGS